MKLPHASTLAAALLAAGATLAHAAPAGDAAWYREFAPSPGPARGAGGTPFEPSQRVTVTVTNPHAFALTKAPVVIKRGQLPVQNVYEDWITPVDPTLEGQAEPSEEKVWEQGTIIKGREENGRHLLYQLDDLDKDGIWDELFFQVDLKAGESKPIQIYFGQNERGLFAHETHAEIGSYGRHLVPWWESKSMGWKLWFIDSVDMYGKRNPNLNANHENTLNISGHVSPKDYGNDIMWVSATFGAGGICVAEDPSDLEKVARPRFKAEASELVGQRFIGTNLGSGPMFDTRVAYHTVVNGPIRSIVRVDTMNWNTGQGTYELRQWYTAYADHNYSTCRTEFTRFSHADNDVRFGVGMRKIMSESSSRQTDSMAVSHGTKLDMWDINASLPEGKKHIIDWEGIAIAVPDKLNPSYHDMKSQDGNHLLTFPVTEDKSFEYMMLAGWNFGYQVNTAAEFDSYVDQNVALFNKPLQLEVGDIESR